MKEERTELKIQEFERKNCLLKVRVLFMAQKIFQAFNVFNFIPKLKCFRLKTINKCLKNGKIYALMAFAIPSCKVGIF